MTENQDSATEFDPDASEEQSPSALEALIGRIEEEMRKCQLAKFSQEDALTLGLLIVELATEREMPVAVDIRRGSHILFHVSLAGATPDNDIWVERKARTAERYGVPSLLVGLRGRRGGGRMENNAWFDESAYAAHGGAFPIYVKGTGPVAVVTVSGLPQKADHQLVVEALTKFSRRKKKTAPS
ncbi:heme-degrading domain-containing protein [uncultured Arthrobacter sp.]|uniref:heme-degrading domain-containing protein n=1 Tax=uncultured Arthrobacter sp. TaxID=114050 RepID=UPI00262BF3EA|nr:heme-degrading domain-containing protein [uncultured Arthrobacter sp.]